MLTRAVTAAIAIAITLGANTPFAGAANPGNAINSLYGPAKLEPREVRRLTRQLDAGPGPGTQLGWFAAGTWSAAGFHLLGSSEPTACTGPMLPGRQWEKHLKAGRQLARVGRWKAARARLKPHVLNPGCVDGPLGERLHGALIDLARTAWYGYPEDESLARRALRAAIRIAPEDSWPHPTEVELEKTYWEERASLVHLKRGRLLVVDPKGLVRVDGRLVDGWVELVPGPHVLQFGKRAVETAVLDVPEGARMVLGRPDGLWELLASLSTEADDLPSEESGFARAALHTHHKSGYWLIADKRAAWVRATGKYTWPPRRDRFILGVGLNYRLLASTTNAPRIVSEAHTEHWLEPRLTVGFRGQAGTRGPQLGLQGSGSVLLAAPVELGLTRKYTRFIPAARVGPTVGMADHNVRLSGGLYAEILFPGTQAVERPRDPDDPTGPTTIELRPVVYVGVVGEVQASLRLDRMLWLTVQAGGGWVASPTFSTGVGLEIRAWQEPR
jgi:hypothetical protein